MVLADGVVKYATVHHVSTTRMRRVMAPIAYGCGGQTAHEKKANADSNRRFSTLLQQKGDAQSYHPSRGSRAKPVFAPKASG